MLALKGLFVFWHSPTLGSNVLVLNLFCFYVFLSLFVIVFCFKFSGVIRGQTAPGDTLQGVTPD